MRVLLRRNLFVGGVRYRTSSNGTDVPDDIELPSDAKVWNGKEFVDPPKDEKDRKALIKKASKTEFEEEEIDLPTRVYDPRYKSPDSKEPIVGQMPLSPEEHKERDAKLQSREPVEEYPAPLTKPKK